MGIPTNEGSPQKREQWDFKQKHKDRDPSLNGNAKTVPEKKVNKKSVPAEVEVGKDNKPSSKKDSKSKKVKK